MLQLKPIEFPGYLLYKIYIIHLAYILLYVCLGPT